MTKEQYITSKTYDPLSVIYHYYQENRDPNKHINLSPQELITYLQMWRSLNLIMETVNTHYEQRFNLMAVLDKDGKFIKYV